MLYASVGHGGFVYTITAVPLPKWRFVVFHPVRYKTTKPIFAIPHLESNSLKSDLETPLFFLILLSALLAGCANAAIAPTLTSTPEPSATAIPTVTDTAAPTQTPTQTRTPWPTISTHLDAAPNPFTDHFPHAGAAEG